MSLLSGSFHLRTDELAHALHVEKAYAGFLTADTEQAAKSFSVSEKIASCPSFDRALVVLGKLAVDTKILGHPFAKLVAQPTSEPWLCGQVRQRVRIRCVQRSAVLFR